MFRHKVVEVFVQCVRMRFRADLNKAFKVVNVDVNKYPVES